MWFSDAAALGDESLSSAAAAHGTGGGAIMQEHAHALEDGGELLDDARLDVQDLRGRGEAAAHAISPD